MVSLLLEASTMGDIVRVDGVTLDAVYKYIFPFEIETFRARFE